MKKIFLALPFVFLMACNNATTTEDTKVTTAEDAHAGHNHAPGEGHGATEETKVVNHKTHDPVCGMERTDKWTEYSVYNNDTVKFCNPVCKENFDKEPTKYIKG